MYGLEVLNKSGSEGRPSVRRIISAEGMFASLSLRSVSPHAISWCWDAFEPSLEAQEAPRRCMGRTHSGYDHRSALACAGRANEASGVLRARSIAEICAAIGSQTFTLNVHAGCGLRHARHSMKHAARDYAEFRVHPM
jgi:hypothetical protein